jgi:hypothetical protein
MFYNSSLGQPNLEVHKEKIKERPKGGAGTGTLEPGSKRTQIPLNNHLP